ncbi:MAG: hypothetical protein [Circular genetic element sp.]|nr:MAG: hypothetical protein [Circular genetic element sp.]
MARSKRTRGVPKLDPSVMTMTYILPAGAPGVSRIDTSQSAALLNRRFYRQGLNWGVAGFRIISPTGVTGSLSVLKLPNTWVMSNAWHKSFAVWNRMNNEAMEENESIRPRFLDYKIYADSAHHAAGFGANLLPISGAGVPATAGEWDASKAVITADGNPNLGTSLEFIATGASYPGVGASGHNAVSLIEGYAASRRLPNIADPNMPDDITDTFGVTPENWMTAVFNEGTVQDEAVLTDLSTENNIAPYPFENDGTAIDTMYPGGANQLNGLEFHDSAFITPTTVGGITSIRGTNFPCGLITIGHNLTAPPEGAVLIEVLMIPGTHRGYLAEPMQDM